MSVVLMEGFDTYNGTSTSIGLANKWSAYNSVGSLVTGRFGGQALRQTSHPSEEGHYSKRGLPSSYSSLTIGVAIKFEVLSNPNNGGFNFAFMNSGTFQVGMRCSNTGVLSIVKPTSETAYVNLASSSAGAVTANTWHYIEMETTINNTTGLANLYVDDALVASISGANTANAGNIGANQICLGFVGTALTVTNADFDDLYINDTTTRLGPRRIQTLYPSADVAQGWARSTGSTNYTLVDETLANGDTDYLTSNTVGSLDMYTFTDLSTVPLSIDAVNSIIYGRKTDASTKIVVPHIVSNTSTSDGANCHLAVSSYTRYDSILETDPATSNTWSVPAINDIRAGPKLVV